MSDRAGEATEEREAAEAPLDGINEEDTESSIEDQDLSTGELVEETQRLLEEIPDEGAPGSGQAGSGPSVDGTGRETESTSDAPKSGGGWFSKLRGSSVEPEGSKDAADDTDESSKDGRFASLSPTRHFSVRSFVVLLLAIVVGLLAGGFLVPIGGRLLGMFVVSFLIGLTLSTRRYLEVATAGVLVGGVSALLNHAILAIAGSGQAVAAVGATAGVLACVVGYYFGRDLRDGLTREVDPKPE